MEIRRSAESDFDRIMQDLLGKLGFIHCGTISVNEDRSPRLAYEKTDPLLRPAEEHCADQKERW